MAIFKITKEKIKAIQSERKTDFFRKESDLENFFENNLETLLGVRFLDRQYPTSANEGFIDTLGIDDDNSPVIIEYKWDKDDRVLTQGQFYYAWLKRNKKVFETLVENKLGKNIKVNWDQPRLILVAQSFSKYIKGATEEIEYVDLVTYACYEPDILHLDGLEISSNRLISPIIDESGNAVLYDRNYHFSLVKSESIKNKAEILRQKVLNLPDVEELLGQKTGISYKTSKKFVRFSFYSSKLGILLKESNYSKDKQNIIEDITNNQWGYNGWINFTDESDADYIFEIIKEAYDKTR